MTRDVDLVSYLPPFLAEFKEYTVTLEAENPEFQLVWSAKDRVLRNEFIATADEYGISRFEHLLNILPSTEDTLESRRARVQSRWFTAIPYTMAVLLAKLIALCGDTDFTVTKKYDVYRVEIVTNLELFGQVEELEHIIENMMPCNMVVISINEMPCNANGFALIAAGVVSAEFFFITNDFRISNTISGDARIFGGVVSADTLFVTNDSKESYSADGEAALRGGVVNTAHYRITNDGQTENTISGVAGFAGGAVTVEEFLITNDSKEDIIVSGSAMQRGGVPNAATVVITNDFNEQFNINGENSIHSGAVVTEIIGISQNSN